LNLFELGVSFVSKGMCQNIEILLHPLHPYARLKATQNASILWCDSWAP